MEIVLSTFPAPNLFPDNNRRLDVVAPAETASVCKISWYSSKNGILYQLDNGIVLDIRWYEDPHFAIGKSVSLMKNKYGILIDAGDLSLQLYGDPQGNYFRSR